MFENINNIEVIDMKAGRLIDRSNIKISAFLQDGGKSLKLVISDIKPDLGVCNKCRHKKVEINHGKYCCDIHDILLDRDTIKDIDTSQCFESSKPAKHAKVEPIKNYRVTEDVYKNNLLILRCGAIISNDSPSNIKMIKKYRTRLERIYPEEDNG